MQEFMPGQLFELTPADELRSWVMSTRRVLPLLANLGLRVPASAMGVAETLADQLDADYERLFKS